MVKSDHIPEIEVTSERHEDPIGTIAMLHQGEVAGETHVSHLQTDWRWAQGRPVNRLFVKGSMLPAQRNWAVHAYQGDWLLFIDSDMVFPPEAIGELVSSYHLLKEQIQGPVMVGGLCCRRYPPYQPTLYQAIDMTEGPFRVVEDWDGQDFVEVDATGCAFLLIEQAVFSAIVGSELIPYEGRLLIPRPFPFFEYHGAMGEDLVFCLKARNNGVRIFVDTRVRIGHVSSHVVGIEDFWKEMALRPEDEMLKVKAMNDTLGLPTLSAKEARARIAG